jgi:tight adherence protein B
MLTALGLAWGLAAGVPLVVLAALAVGIYQPVLALVGLVAALVLTRTRLHPRGSESAFLQAVAAELRSGAAVRVAIADAAERMPSLSLTRVARLARAGRPLDELAVHLRSALSRNGTLVAAAVRIAGRTGGKIADTFDELALIAGEDMELRGETRAATAQARLSAWIVGGIPVAYLAYTAASGRLSALVDTGAVGIGVLGVGGTLLIAGVVTVIAIVRRAQR